MAQQMRKKRKWQRRLRYFYHRFVRLQGSPEAIARGIAAGVFAGWFPLFGFQTIIGVAIAAVMRGNKIMAAASTWVSNPLTYVPIYAFNFQIGQLVLGSGQETYGFGGLQSWTEVMSLGTDLLFTLFFGCTVVGLFFAIISYFAGLRLVRTVRHQRHRQRQRRQASSKRL